MEGQYFLSAPECVVTPEDITHDKVCMAAGESRGGSKWVAAEYQPQHILSGLMTYMINVQLNDLHLKPNMMSVPRGI